MQDFTQCIFIYTQWVRNNITVLVSTTLEDCTEVSSWSSTCVGQGLCRGFLIYPYIFSSCEFIWCTTSGKDQRKLGHFRIDHACGYWFHSLQPFPQIRPCLVDSRMAEHGRLHLGELWGARGAFELSLARAPAPCERSRSVLGSTQWGADPGHVRQTCLAVIGRGQSVGVMAPQNQGAGTRTVNIQFRLHAASFQSRCLFQPNPRWLEEVAPLRLTVDHIYQYHRH